MAAKKRSVGGELLQTRVPKDVFEWANAQAEERGLTAAAWLRELVQTEHRRERIAMRAVWRETFLKDRSPRFAPIDKPDLYLEPIWDVPGPSLSFWIRSSVGQGYEDYERIRKLPFIAKRKEYWFILAGSRGAWACDWLRFDASGSRTAICLRVDPSATNRSDR